MYSQRTVDKLNEIAYYYSELMKQAINDVLRSYSNTGAGAASVTIDVVEGDETKSPVIQINFDDHVLYLDKRRMAWTKLPRIQPLMEWAETKKSDPKEAKQLAWAKAWDLRKNNTWKPKRWRKRSLSSVLKEMNELIIKAYNEVIDADFQQAIDVAAPS